MNSQSFDSIEDLRQHYCEKHLCEAPEEIFGMNCNMPAIIRANPGTCKDFCQDHPKEAAELMGYKVVEEKKNDKPRICEILGVDVGERFKSPLDCADICIKSDGFPVFPDHENDTIPARYIVALINDPDSIIRKPRFTKQEIEDAKTLIRICPENLDSITRTKDGDILLSSKGMWIGCLASSAFPSLAPGQTVKVQDIIENSEQKS